jgi:hypothetical protein
VASGPMTLYGVLIVVLIVCLIVFVVNRLR